MEDALQRWQSEKTAAYLSRAVAENEPDPKRAKLFEKMAAAAENQAGILAKELKTVPVFRPSMRSRITVFLLGILPPRAMRNVLSAHKVRGVSVYRTKLPEPEKKDESGHPWPTSVDEIGQQHKNYTSGTLRAGVFGVNDGLVSNTCLVMGVAGAGVGASEILLTGVAGLLGGLFRLCPVYGGLYGVFLKVAAAGGVAGALFCRLLASGPLSQFFRLLARQTFLAGLKADTRVLRSLVVAPQLQYLGFGGAVILHQRNVAGAGP